MLEIDPSFETRPLVHKTISRIFRDTRFSRDGSLFRDRMWLVFKRPIKDWKDAPGYFFELAPDRYRFGMGYYMASRATMDRFRRRIDADPGAFLDLLTYRRKRPRFELAGDKYRNPLASHHVPEIQDWYQRKSFYLSCARTLDDTLFSPRLVRDLACGFRNLAPLYRFLIELGRGDGA
jgi:uncharacterized protein (DUF2461 family)